VPRTKQPWKCGPPGSVSSILAGGFTAGVAAAVVLILTRFAIGLGAAAVVARLLPWHAPTRDIVHGEFWSALKIAAYPLAGARVYRPGFDAPVVCQAIVVLLLLCISTGVVFALVARGRSFMATCMLSIPFGFAAWIIQLLLTHPSPVTIIEAIPSGLALAFTFLWYERRLPFRRRSSGARRQSTREARILT
jgi:hypothetical protein